MGKDEIHKVDKEKKNQKRERRRKEKVAKVMWKKFAEGKRDHLVS